MTFKKVWKTGNSYVVSLNFNEVNHLELWQGNNVTIDRKGKHQLVITRFPKVKPRNK